jgi:peptide/nickel transport system permease protein
MATTDLGIIMLVTSGLSFVGLGARPPTPDLGAMIAAGRVHAIDYWWIIAFPGLAIAIAALGSSLAGDTLRDRLDPTSGD